jgi:mannose-6-phosphate isomerase-like protein (cupin superfamily)
MVVLLILGILYHLCSYICEPQIKEHYEKPWGGYRNIADDDEYRVKMLVVNPDECTSLQSHKHRNEVWVIAKGVATVTYGEQVFDMKVGDTVKIIDKIQHRISNNTLEPLVIVELWYGKELSEDDITRYDDKYGRIG